MQVSKNCSGEYRKKGPIRVSTEKWSNLCEYRKTVRVSTDKKSPISVTTEKLLNLCEYQEKVESVRVSKNCLGEYLEKVESLRV